MSDTDKQPEHDRGGSKRDSEPKPSQPAERGGNKGGGADSDSGPVTPRSQPPADRH